MEAEHGKVDYKESMKGANGTDLLGAYIRDMSETSDTQ